MGTQNKLFVPSTNNALEATNRALKDQFTFCERMSMGEFVNIALVKMIKQYSKRCGNDQLFASKLTISTNMYATAYRLI